MKTKHFSFLLEATQPICHLEGSFGNHGLIMRRKVRQPDGQFALVPIVSGNTIRHAIREASAYALLDAAGLLDDERLTQSALRLLFNGGMVGGRGDGGAVNFDEYRTLTELVPTLAVLGGCASNRIIPGRASVDEAVLVCEETAHKLPEWVRAHIATQQLASCREHIEEVQRVRMDSILDPNKRRLLTAGEQVDANKRLSASGAASESDEAIERQATKSTMMPYTYERVVDGSLFHWSFTATTYTELDDDTLLTMLGVFLSRPVVGGKRGTGHGLMRVVAARDISIRRMSEQTDVIDMSALGPRVGELFRAHIRDRAERLKEFLTQVAA